jgi:hypothetical protein
VFWVSLCTTQENLNTFPTPIPKPLSSRAGLQTLEVLVLSPCDQGCIGQTELNTLTTHLTPRVPHDTVFSFFLAVLEFELKPHTC